MEQYPVTALATDEAFPLLREIPQPPQSLNYRGTLPPADLPLIAVVGSRQYTNYGKAVVEHIIAGLAGYYVGIVSGLAIGIDGLAHEAALKNNLYTVAVPGGGLGDSVLYPRRHKRLAYQILEHGGTLVSEYEPTQAAASWTFPQRNRIVCGMCVATVVIEAAERSGSLITARMATDYNRELFVVPGDIFSTQSSGCHQFLKLGATPLTTAEDIIDALNLAQKIEDAAHDTAPTTQLTPLEQEILAFLDTPQERDVLIQKLSCSTSEANVVLTKLELAGHIIETAGTYRKKT